MGENRKMLVKKAFAKMDKSGDGIITIDDILETYDVRMHPKFQNGEMTKREVLMEFLGNFEADDHKDGKVVFHFSLEVVTENIVTRSMLYVIKGGHNKEKELFIILIL